jgi:hypothetical protein
MNGGFIVMKRIKKRPLAVKEATLPIPNNRPVLFKAFCLYLSTTVTCFDIEELCFCYRHHYILLWRKKQKDVQKSV